MSTDEEFEAEQAYIEGAYSRLDAMRRRAEALVGQSEDPDLEAGSGIVGTADGVDTSGAERAEVHHCGRARSATGAGGGRGGPVRVRVRLGRTDRPDRGAREPTRALLVASEVDFSDASAGQLGRDVALIPAPTAKGLEFDAVVVVEPAAIVADAPRGLRLLYVAMTRPTKHLSIVHHDPLPEPLAG